MLDARLRRIAELVEPGSRLVDIGSDHARLPVWLVRSGRCPRAIATDVRRGPLENARRHVEEAGLSDRIELRLGDGLQPVRPGEGDVFVIAGMGGGTIAQILAAAGWAQDPALLWLLQPMTKPELLRKYLNQNGFRIEREWIVPDGPHDYPVLCVRGGAVCETDLGAADERDAKIKCELCAAGERAAHCGADLRAVDEPSAKIKCELRAAGERAAASSGADLRAADERDAKIKCELCAAGDPVKWVLGEVRLPEGERYLRRQRRRFEKQLHGLRCLLAAGNAAGEAAALCETDLRAADGRNAKIKRALPRCPALSTSRQRERCLGKSACRPLEGTAVALRATRVFADGANPGGTPCQSPTAAATRANASR